MLLPAKRLARRILVSAGLFETKQPSRPLAIAEHLKLASNHRTRCNLPEALKSVNAALEMRPNDIRALRIKADVLVESGLHDDARITCHEILALAPTDVAAIKMLQSLGDDHAFDASPSFVLDDSTPAACLSSASYLIAGSHFQDGEKYATAGLRLCNGLGPLRDPLAIARGAAYEGLGQLDKALDDFRSVTCEKHKSAAMAGIARCELERGDPIQAAAALEIGERVQNHVYTKEHLPVLYALGRIREAHRTYRARKTSRLIAETFNKGAPIWMSIRDANNKTHSAFVFSEGGPGDEIRFSAMYRELATMFREVTITCEPRLFTLLSRSIPEVRFLPVARYREEYRSATPQDRTKVPNRGLIRFVSDDALDEAKKADLVFSTLDALGELRCEREDFRCSLPLRPCPELLANVKRQIGGSDRLRVGVAWRSMLQSHTRNKHYFSTSDLRALATRDVELWVLQPNATEDELADLRSAFPHVHMPSIDLKDDFEGQAAFMSCMDCVISPMTTTAELAGSLGVETILVALSKTTEWRKNQDGSDVWYPLNGRLVTSVTDAMDAIF